MKKSKLDGIVYLTVTILLILAAFAMGQEVTGLIIDQNGNVGIGDAVPGYKLSVGETLGAKI